MPQALPHTMNQTVVMTGATRGIGRVTAQRLLTRQPGTHLVLLSRGDTTDIVADLQKAGGTVSAIPTDLTSLHSVYAAATTVAHRCCTGDLPPLGAVVCNAGVQRCTDTTPAWSPVPASRGTPAYCPGSR